MRKDIIRVSTKEMSRADWLAYRQNGIGGSEVGVVLGLSQYKSSLELFYEKIQPTPQAEENEAMHWGKALEDLVADRWQYWDGDVQSMMKNFEAGEIIRRCWRVNAYLINPDYPHLFASLDRIIHKKKKSPEGVLEVKTISGWTSKQWEGGIPPSYVTQLQAYLLITGLEWGEIALLSDGRFMEVLPFQKSEIICNEIIGKTERFWQRVLRAREILKEEGVVSFNELPDGAARVELTALEPDADGSVAYENFLASRYKVEPIEVQGTEEQFLLAEAYVNCNEEIKQTQEKQRLISNTLKSQMQSAEILSFGTRGKVTWKENKSGSRVFNVKLK